MDVTERRKDGREGGREEGILPLPSDGVVPTKENDEGRKMKAGRRRKEDEGRKT